jgi:hypothetical protein
VALRLVQFLAIMLTALALVPSWAHLAALPNKMAMAQAAYFVARQIYAGWALFGIVLFGALIANLAHAIVLPKLGGSFGYALAPFLLIAANLAIFFVWTFPTNQGPTTGPLYLRTGMRCVSNGNIRTLPTPS